MKRFIIIIVLFLSVFGIFDLFLPGFYSSHDGVGHAIRLEECYKAINDGSFPVRWSPRLYFGYGYPFFNFNYPAVCYLGYPFMRAGLGAGDTVKAELAGSFAISGLLMFLYLRRKTKLSFAVLGTMLYLYAPYRMSTIYVRGSVAEAMAFIFPPLLLWGAEALTKKDNRNILWVSLIFGFMGISHNISMLLLSGFFFTYLAVLSFSTKSLWPLIRGLISFTLGVMMASFFIVPALYEKRWTLLDLTIAKDYPDHFVYPFQLFLPNWGYGGSVKGPNDGITFGLGLVQIGLAIFALKAVFQKSFRTALILFCFLITAVAIFFMLEPSRFLWDHLPLLPFVQFPWRFTILAVPALAILGSLAASSRGSKTAIILIFLTILSANYMWHRNQTTDVPVIAGDAFLGSTTWADEQATMWLVPKPNKVPVNKIEGAGYGIKSWKTGEHSYTVSTKKAALVTENTMYYPGWEVWVDGQPEKINHDKGKISYSVSPGDHSIVTRFTETPLRKSVDLISLGTFVVVVLSLLLGYTVPKIFPHH